MKSPNKETLEAILQLGGSPHSWNVVMTWLKVSVSDLTYRALQSADARLCGAAYELQDLIDKLESARDLLDKLKKPIP